MRAPGAALAAALALSILSAPRRAEGEPSPNDSILARTLFASALAEMKERDYASACPKLEESERLDPGMGTLYHLAECYEGLGRLASAWTRFSDAADAAKRAGDRERETVARQSADALVPRLPRLKVAAPLSPDITLTLDGAPFARSVVGDLPPVDPGEHELGADAPGKKHGATKFSAIEASLTTVTVPALEPLPRPPAPPPPQPTPAATSWHGSAAVLAAGLGLVGLGIGTAFGVNAIDDWSTAKQGCSGGGCDPLHFPSWQSAHSAGVASTVSFVVGASLVAAGGVLWLTRPHAASAGVGIRPDGAVVVGGVLP